MSERERYRPWFREWRMPSSPLRLERGDLYIDLGGAMYMCFGPIRPMPEYFVCAEPTWRIQ